PWKEHAGSDAVDRVEGGFEQHQDRPVGSHDQRHHGQDRSGNLASGEGWRDGEGGGRRSADDEGRPHDDQLTMNARDPAAAKGGPTLRSRGRGSGVSDDGHALLREDDAPHGYVSRLMEDGFQNDAVKLLGALLPPREAIWWAWTCSRKATADEASAEAE